MIQGVTLHDSLDAAIMRREAALEAWVDNPRPDYRWAVDFWEHRISRLTALIQKRQAEQDMKPTRGRPRIHQSGGERIQFYLPTDLITWLKAQPRPMSQTVTDALRMVQSGTGTTKPA